MPRVPAGITSTPDVPGQPYDATSDAPLGKWQSVNTSSGPASMDSGQATGDFEDGPGPWKQT
jgi:hypothetical protein